MRFVYSVEVLPDTYPKSNLMKIKLNLLKTFIVLLATGFSIAASAQCQAGFTYSYSGPNIVFTNTSVGASLPLYSWNFGDNQSDNSANPVHAYSQVGTYMVCLTYTDSLTSCQSVFCDTVVVSSACGMSISVTSTSESSCGNCDGASAATVTGGQSPYVYAWSNGGTSSSLSSLCHGGYSLTVTDANGCTASSNTYVNCPQQNSCQALYSASISGYTVTFTNLSTGTMQPNYYWDFGDSQNSWSTNPTHTYNTPGVYPVFLSIYDSISFCQSSYVDSISVMVGCGMNLNLTSVNASDCSLCDGSAALNVTGGTAPYTYLWSNSSTNSSLSNLCAGYYSVTVTDANGCILTGSTQITCPQQNGCQASFTYTVNANVVTFTNTSTALSSQANYWWSFGPNSNWGGPNPPNFVFSTTGYHAVCLTLTDSTFCTSTFCDSIYIASVPCSASFQMIQDSLNPLVWYAFPTITGTAPFTYLWSFGDNNSSTQAFPTHNYANAGQYTVCLSVTDANGCTSMFCDSTSVQRMMQSSQMQYLIVMNIASGISEQSNNDLHVWPNPASDNIMISMKEANSGVLRITGLAGNLIAEQQISGKQSSVDVSQLPAGIYNLSITSGDASWNQKIVIVR